MGTDGRTDTTCKNKTAIIDDPLGQTHSLASSKHCFRLNLIRFEKWGRTDLWTDGRTTCVKTMIATAVTVGRPRRSTNKYAYICNNSGEIACNVEFMSILAGNFFHFGEIQVFNSLQWSLKNEIDDELCSTSLVNLVAHQATTLAL